MSMYLASNEGIKILKYREGSYWSCHGGNYLWDRHVLDPSLWTHGLRNVEFGRYGYHLTIVPVRWWNQNNLRAFLAEYMGEVDAAGTGDVCVSTCRLLRPLTSTELASMNVYIDGEHEVINNHGIDGAVVAGNAKVSLLGGGYVRRYDSATVESPDPIGVRRSAVLEVPLDLGSHYLPREA